KGFIASSGLMLSPRLLRLRREFAQRRPHLLFSAAALDRQGDFCSRRGARYQIGKRIRIVNRRPIESRNHVSLSQTSAFRGTARLHLEHGHARTLVESQLSGFRGRYFGDEDPKLPPAHFTSLDQLVHHSAGHVRRDRKTESDASTRRRKDLGIDPDQLARR